MAVTHDLPKRVAAAWIERAEALGLKGKRRDQECLTYFVGAAKACELTGAHEDRAWLANVIFILSIRGHAEAVAITQRV